MFPIVSAPHSLEDAPGAPLFPSITPAGFVGGVQPLLFFFLIELWLIYNIVLISAVQQSDAVIHRYIFSFTYIFSFSLWFIIGSTCFLIWSCPFPNPSSWLRETVFSTEAWGCFRNSHCSHRVWCRPSFLRPTGRSLPGAGSSPRAGVSTLWIARPAAARWLLIPGAHLEGPKQTTEKWAHLRQQPARQWPGPPAAQGQREEGEGTLEMAGLVCASLVWTPCPMVSGAEDGCAQQRLGLPLLLPPQSEGGREGPTRVQDLVPLRPCPLEMMPSSVSWDLSQPLRCDAHFFGGKKEQKWREGRNLPTHLQI